MSDGLYIFKATSQRDEDEITGQVKIKQGKFSGKNLRYSYHGSFLIEENTLNINAELINKITGQRSTFQCSTTFENDRYVTFSAEIGGNLFLFELRKEEGFNTVT